MKNFPKKLLKFDQISGKFYANGNSNHEYTILRVHSTSRNCTRIARYARQLKYESSKISLNLLWSLHEHFFKILVIFYCFVPLVSFFLFLKKFRSRKIQKMYSVGRLLLRKRPCQRFDRCLSLSVSNFDFYK